MVARIVSGSSPAGALYYNQRKIVSGTATFLCANRSLLAPGEAFDVQRAIDTFEPYLTVNRRTKMPTFHVSLNPSPEDRLTDDQLREIAREYMERMGYGSQPYFVFRHSDIAREHLHIVSLRIDTEGRKLPHDFEARRSMIILRDIEQKYGLHPAAPGQIQEQDQRSGLYKVDYQASDLKQQIGSLVRTVLHKYRCSSYDDLRTLLACFNVGITEQVGNICGHDYAGIVYQALTDEGLRVGLPLKSSRIGRDVGYKALERYYERSRERIVGSPRLDDLRNTVAQALRKADSQADFEERLRREHITAVVPCTEQGRIYATTFIDHRSGLVATDALLGEQFAAYRIDWRFNGPPREESTGHAFGQKTFSLGAELLELLNIHDPEEEQVIIRRRRKKRKRLKF